MAEKRLSLKDIKFIMERYDKENEGMFVSTIANKAGYSYYVMRKKLDQMEATGMVKVSNIGQSVGALKYKVVKE